MNEDGSFEYTPNADFAGSDTFTYYVNDGSEEKVEGTVTVTVQEKAAPAPTPSPGPSQNNSSGGGGSMSFPLLLLLVVGCLSLWRKQREFINSGGH